MKIKALHPAAFAATLSMLIFVVPSWGVAAGGTDKPNVVLILADDLGWADLPAYGNRFNEAPHLDRLAREGMRFTDAYATCPVCSPTRASLVSGQYPARVGVIDWIPGHWRPFEKVLAPKNRTQHLPGEIVTLAQSMRSARYATAMFGKWHLGDAKEHHPLNRGFDEANVGQGFFNVRFNPPREMSSEKIMAERLADFGIEFIERNRDRPFFLLLSHWDVHCLFDAEQPVIDKYAAKSRVDGYACNPVYAAMIEHLDRSTGRVLDALERLNLSGRTVVVFYSDNGGCISENKYPGIEEDLMPMIMPSKRDAVRDSPFQYIATSNLPLRGEKGTVYEGGIRVPLIARWPGRIRPGSVSRALVTTVDFYPTFLELAGAEAPAGQALDGKSILPELVDGVVDPERAIFWHYPVYHHDVPAAAVRQGEWKLIENLEAGSAALYHLGADFGETTDLSGVFPDKAAELRGRLARWQTEVGASFPEPNPAFDPARRHEWGEHPDKLKR